MRKITPDEFRTLTLLAAYEPYCPGSLSGEAVELLKHVLDRLVKKGRVRVEVADDGPQYWLSTLGREEVAP